MANPGLSVGKVTIRRNSSRDIKMRDLYVEIDGEPTDTLQFGESLELELPAGHHTIKVTNRVYSKSEDFSIQPGESVRFDVGNVPSRGLVALLMAITGTIPYRVNLTRL